MLSTKKSRKNLLHSQRCINLTHSARQVTSCDIVSACLTWFLEQLDAPRKGPGTSADAGTLPAKLSDGTIVTYERSRQFMDYYCRRFSFSKPDIIFNELKTHRSHHIVWEAVMYVSGRRIG